MKNKQKKDKESGQAILEFVLIFPIFVFVILIVVDFGWLFYNYISVENSARNAARIACVEYQDCCYDDESKTPETGPDGEGKVFAVEDVEPYFNTSGMDPDQIPYTEQEINIVRTAVDTLPGSISDVTVKVSYSYDSSAALDYNVNSRCNGDVTVYVSGKLRVLTPILGNADNHMLRDVGSKSTYKVERNSSDDSE